LAGIRHRPEGEAKIEHDPEKQYIEGLARIKCIEATISTIQSNIKNLKSSFQKLSARIDHIEIQRFQEQLTSLSSSLLETNRGIANFEIDFIQYHVINATRSQNISSVDRKRLSGYITLEFGRVQEAIKHSIEPLSIATEFRKKCVEVSKEYGLDAFGI